MRERARAVAMTVAGWLSLAACPSAPAPRAPANPAAAAAPAAPPTPAVAPVVAAASTDAPERSAGLDDLREPGSRRLPGSIICEPEQLRNEARNVTHVRGTLDKESVHQIIVSHVSAITRCYEASMITPPYPRGKVHTRFALDGTGKVRYSCVISTTMNQPKAERCIVDEMLTWQFPEPLGGGWVVVTYPWTFEPAEERPR